MSLVCELAYKRKEKFLYLCVPIWDYLNAMLTSTTWALLSICCCCIFTGKKPRRNNCICEAWHVKSTEKQNSKWCFVCNSFIWFCILKIQLFDLVYSPGTLTSLQPIDLFRKLCGTQSFVTIARSSYAAL